MCMSMLESHLSMYNIVFCAWEMSVFVQVLVTCQPPSYMFEVFQMYIVYDKMNE